MPLPRATGGTSAVHSQLAVVVVKHCCSSTCIARWLMQKFLPWSDSYCVKLDPEKIILMVMLFF